MLFSSSKHKHTLLIYVRRAALEFYDKTGLLGQIPLPAEIVQNLELADPKRLNELVNQFAMDHQLHDQRAMLVLDDGVVFQKAVKVADAGSDQAALKDFNEIVPFDPDTVAIAMLVSHEQYFLFATNKKLCQEISRALELTNNKVTAATPAAVFGVSELSGTDQSAVSTFLADNKFTQEVNFLA